MKNVSRAGQVLYDDSEILIMSIFELCVMLFLVKNMIQILNVMISLWLY